MKLKLGHNSRTKHWVMVLGKDRGRGTVTVVDGVNPSRGAASPVVFTFADGLSWDDPRKLGEAFASYARDRALQPRHIGAIALPGDYVALRQATFPPTEDREMLPGMVEMAADELFAERLEELTLAYRASSGPDATRVSIFACHRDRLEKIREFCVAAGIEGARVVPIAGVCAGAVADAGTLLIQSHDEGELIAIDKGLAACVGMLSLPTGRAEMWESELRKLSLTWPIEKNQTGVAWSSPEVAQTASRALGITLVPAQQDALSLIAGAVRQVRDGSLDFAARRRTGPSRNWKTLLRRGAVAAVLLLCVLGYFTYDWLDARGRASDAQRWLDSVEKDADTVQRQQNLIDATNPWFQTQPEHLEALKALTDQFPEAGSVWLTSCQMESGGQVVMVGKARSRSAVLSLLADLEKSTRFDRVTPAYIRQQTGGDGLVTFAATCRYKKAGDA
ncbi:MAG: hypothetical protein GC164_14285 [Phycisphaera sp.]|nr:hypothetical protein [Phycisphaera sp.]